MQLTSPGSCRSSDRPYSLDPCDEVVAEFLFCVVTSSQCELFIFSHGRQHKNCGRGIKHPRTRSSRPVAQQIINQRQAPRDAPDSSSRCAHVSADAKCKRDSGIGRPWVARPMFAATLERQGIRQCAPLSCARWLRCGVANWRVDFGVS